MNYNSEKNKLKSLVSESTYELLQENNAIIAGGAITSLFCNREVNDLDIYFKNENDFVSFITEAYSSNGGLRCNNMTNRSLLFKDTATDQDVQVIIYKWFPTIDDLFNDYDFTVNMGAFDCASEVWTFCPHFFKHNSQRYLQFNNKTAYPLISGLRVNKYIEKGYTISKTQMLRVLLTISQLEIDSWDKLKDHIGGMYGLKMDDVFPENEAFNLDTALTVLDNIEPHINMNYRAREISMIEILEQCIGKSSTGREDCSDKYFKNVYRDCTTGEISSFFKPEFKYVVGETIDGGKNGIYCTQGYDVLDGQYSRDYNSVILELDVSGAHKERWIDSFTGPVKVVAVYTKAEFIRKYQDLSI